MAGIVCAHPLSSSHYLPFPAPQHPTLHPSYFPPAAQLYLPLQVNTIPASFHDGLLLYIQAVTETLAHGGAVTDGEGITQRMWNRSFQGQGLQVAGMGYPGAPGRRQQEASRPAVQVVTYTHQSLPLLQAAFRLSSPSP